MIRSANHFNDNLKFPLLKRLGNHGLTVARLKFRKLHLLEKKKVLLSARSLPYLCCWWVVRGGFRFFHEYIIQNKKARNEKKGEKKRKEKKKLKSEIAAEFYVYIN